MVSIRNCVIVLREERGMEREWGESLMDLLLFSFEHDICSTFQGKSWESCYKAATLLLSVAPFSNFSVLCHFGFVVWWYRPDSKDPGAEVPVYSVFKHTQVSSRHMLAVIKEKKKNNNFLKRYLQVVLDWVNVQEVCCHCAASWELGWEFKVWWNHSLKSWISWYRDSRNDYQTRFQKLCT